MTALKWFFSTHVSFDMPSSTHYEGTPFMAILFLALSATWAARDAVRRGKSPLIAVAFVLLALWPFSLLFWLWLRPPALFAKAQSTPPPLNTVLRPTASVGG